MLWTLVSEQASRQLPSARPAASPWPLVGDSRCQGPQPHAGSRIRRWQSEGLRVGSERRGNSHFVLSGRDVVTRVAIEASWASDGMGQTMLLFSNIRYRQYGKLWGAGMLTETGT